MGAGQLINLFKQKLSAAAGSVLLSRLGSTLFLFVFLSCSSSASWEAGLVGQSTFSNDAVEFYQVETDVVVCKGRDAIFLTELFVAHCHFRPDECLTCGLLL